VIEFNNVSHYFSSKNGELQVLDNLSFSVPKNGFSAIVGPSGCGKSTVTKLIAGLMKPRKGSIILNGEAVQSPRSNIGMAFQNPVLLEWRNILKNVMLPLEIVHNKLSNEEKVD
jgi:NitT/TauT family transport system ATP-binding protein